MTEHNPTSEREKLDAILTEFGAHAHHNHSGSDKDCGGRKDAIKAIELLLREAREDELNGMLVYKVDDYVRQLLTDVLAAVFPPELDTDGSSGKWVNGFNDCRDQIKTNAEKLLGGENNG